MDSLQHRVSTLSALTVVLTAVLVGGAAFGIAGYALAHQLDEILLSSANRMISSAPRSGDTVERFGSDTQMLADGLTFAVITPTGVLHPQTGIEIEPGAPEQAVARGERSESARNTVASNGADYRMVAVPLDEAGTALVVARPLRNQQAVLRLLGAGILALGALSAAAAALLSAALARSSLRPVAELTSAFELVAHADVPSPVRVEGRHELSRLAYEFNQMLAALTRAREQQARLIADAGHELRTPLTSLRTNIELLDLDQTSGLLEPEAREAILGDLKEQVAEFAMLVTDLVQLARDDQDAFAPDAVDVAAVLQTAVRRARRRRSGMEFDVRLPSFFVIGEAGNLERAFTNLLDNAVKFSPEGGTITVSLLPEADRCVIRIADQGAGIPAAELGRVFDRFYRCEATRQLPGTGLGLSIVAQAMERHHGRVEAGRAAEGGAEFRLWLPGARSKDELLQRDPDQGQLVDTARGLR